MRFSLTKRSHDGSSPGIDFLGPRRHPWGITFCEHHRKGVLALLHLRDVLPLKTLSERWNRFWFEPSRPENLGVCRLLFFGLLFFYYLPVDFSLWAEVSKVFWMPGALFRYLHLPIFSKPVLEFFQVLWKTALFFTAIGLWTRLNAVISLFGGIYLLGLPHNFGKIHHSDAMVVLIMGLMALSYSGQAWSLDRLRKIFKNPKFPASDELLPNGEYTWPVRGAWMVMALIFFAVGFAKLKNSGWAWDPMAFLLPGIRVLTGPSFETFLFCYVFWIPWEKAGEWLRRNFFSGKNQMTVFYDGSCGLCIRTMSIIRALDINRCVGVEDALKGWPEISKNFPSLNQAACLNDMHAVTPEGKIVSGFEAYRALAWVLPLGWLLLPVLYFPIVSQAGKFVYRRVASGRHRGGCPLPPR